MFGVGVRTNPREDPVPKPARQASVQHAHPIEVWTLTLNRYQRDNLLLLLNAVGYPGHDNPHIDPVLELYANGDWVGEIAWMLAKASLDDTDTSVSIVIDEDDHPNMRPLQRPPREII